MTNMDRPAIGSTWEHHSGRIYQVLGIANNVDTPKEDYPVTVIYSNVENGTLWSGRLDNWHRRMRPWPSNIVGAVIEVPASVTAAAAAASGPVRDLTNPFQDRSEIQHKDHDAPTPLIPKDHERIWLQNGMDAAESSEGRMWCQDKVWPDDESAGEPTEYVRADLYQAEQIKTHETLHKLAQLQIVLKSLVSDIKAMQSCDPIAKYWFVDFSEWTDNPDNEFIAIEWPNLAITCEQAEALLKELET